MEASERPDAAPQPDERPQQEPWVRDPEPVAVPRHEACGPEDVPLEEPGYGHGV